MSAPMSAEPAVFITSGRSHTEAGTAAPYFRREFTVRSGLVSATLRMTALGIVSARINGQPVSDEVLCPGWTSYDNRTLVSEVDVTALLGTGINVLGAVVGEGWAVGSLAMERKRNGWADRPALYLDLVLEYADSSDRVGTGAGWRTSTGAFVADSLYDGETYDARLEPAGWDAPGFDAAAWEPVEVLDRDLDTLAARTTPPVRRTEVVPAVEVLTTPSGRTVVDFGQNLVGWVRLTVDGPAGARVTLRHTELLVAGEPDYEPNRTALATDRYTLRDGRQVWEPTFTFHGFRYVDVEGWPGELSAADIEAVVVHSDNDRAGWFSCSDDRVNRLHENAVWSWRGNSVSLPTDCPQRDERLGWTGDINAFASTACDLYDVRAFLASWLVDLAAEQKANGGIVPYVVPDVLHHQSGPTALWGDVAISLPWTLYWEYGDSNVLADQYESVVAFLDSVEPHLSPAGVWATGYQFGDWVDPDAPPHLPSKAKTESQLVATAYLVRTTIEAARIAEVLGRTDDAARFRALHDRTRKAFQDEWVSPVGRITNEAQTAYALALCFDILEPEQRVRAGRRLVELVKANGHRISTGFAGTPWVLPALSAVGASDVAYRMLLQTSPPSFLYPVTMGATTVWERWDAVLPDGTLNSTGMTSLNHYALGAVVDWLYREVGGLTQTEAGYAAVRIAPVPGGGLTWASIRRRTASGDIAVAWRDEDGRRSVEVHLPVGVRAHVVLPGHPDGLELDVVGGEHRWEYVIPVSRTRYTLDSPFDELREDESVWRAVNDVLCQAIPGVPDLIEYVAQAAPDLRTTLIGLPGGSDSWERPLVDALSVAQG